jgi:hypothetical protein
MSTATPSRTGQEPRTSVAGIHNAPLATRVGRHTAARNIQLAGELQCYIRVSPSTNRAFCVPDRVAERQSQLSNHRRTSRRLRLETAVTRRKQRSAALGNRQLSRASRVTNHESQITNHAVSNRHTRRLEMSKKPTKSPFSTLLIVTISRFSSATKGESRHGMRTLNRTPRAGPCGQDRRLLACVGAPLPQSTAKMRLQTLLFQSSPDTRLSLPESV